MDRITFTVPAVPVAQTMPRWTRDEIDFLTANYPTCGKMACAKALKRTEAEVRYKASHLGLRLDTQSEFFREFQSRAALSKVGRNRPEQSLVMKSLHAAGKLRKTQEQRQAMGQRQAAWLRQNGHPRGALGMKHTTETKDRIAEHSRRAWQMKTPKQRRARNLKILSTRAANGTMAPDCKRGSWKAAWRKIGSVRKFYRSRWEANYARFLEWRRSRGEIADWCHEPETFWFKGIKRGCVSYLPDFRITNPDGTVEYHEVKGWMDDRSKTKLKRMKKYHPGVVLVVIDGKAYKQLEKLFCAAIPDWE